MSRKAFLVAILAVSTGLFGQRSGSSGGAAGSGSAGAGATGSGTAAGSGINTPASQAGTPTTQGAVGGLSGQQAAGPINTPSANTSGTPTVPGAMAGPEGTSGTTQANPDNLNNGGNINNNGFVGGVSGSGVISTPTATFAAPAPTAGISDAGRAGISADTTANPGVTSTLDTSTTVVYTNAAPINPRGANVSPAANSSGRMINDLGPSYFSNTVNGSSAVSLGEVAAQLKSTRGTANARMLTNDDVQKMLSNDTGVTVARNMPPLGPGAAVQGGAQTTASQTPGSQAAGAATGAQADTQAAQSSAGNQQTQSGAAGQQSANTSSANAGQSANAQTAEDSTTPQINQQQSNDNQGRSRLPATSTFLPLLGLLGVVSGGLGIWLRKFRR
jgi:trimeric autotransporter adhesin